MIIHLLLLFFILQNSFCKEELTVEELVIGQHKDKKDQTEQEESQMLAKIVHKIDMDHDGFISLEELTKHMESTYKILEAESVRSAFRQLKHVLPDFITEEEFLLDMFQVSKKDIDSLNDDYLRGIIKKEMKRFHAADLDKDDRLSLDEYQAFMHPDNYPHMRELQIDDMFDTLDSNKDGLITEEEYIEPQRNARSANIDYQREMFREHDLDKDGFLNREELIKWIHPDMNEAIRSQSRLLLEQCDVDHDGKLTEKEILDKIESWRNHQATNYGSMLKDIPNHDEL